MTYKEYQKEAGDNNISGDVQTWLLYKIAEATAGGGGNATAANQILQIAQQVDGGLTTAQLLTLIKNFSALNSTAANQILQINQQTAGGLSTAQLIQLSNTLLNSIDTSNLAIANYAPNLQTIARDIIDPVKNTTSGLRTRIITNSNIIANGLLRTNSAGKVVTITDISARGGNTSIATNTLVQLRDGGAAGVVKYSWPLSLKQNAATNIIPTQLDKPLITPITFSTDMFLTFTGGTVNFHNINLNGYEE